MSGEFNNQIKVLFIDDEPDLLKQAKNFLENEDDRLKVKTLQSAKEGLEVIEDETIDAIVSDYKIPEMDGLEFLKELRGRGDETPFILLTGRGKEEIAMKALNLGANQYLQKEKDPELLFSILADSIVTELEHWESERKLRENEEKYRKLAESSPNAILVSDAETGEIIEANPEAEKLLDLPRDEIVGMYQWEIHPNDEVEKYKEIFQQHVVEEGKVSEISMDVSDLFVVSASDEKIPVEISSSTLELRGRKVIQSVFRDVSELKRAERELAFESGLLNSLLENIPDSVYFKDSEARFLRVSKSKAEHLDTDRESIIGKTDFDFYPEEEAEEMYADDMRVIEEEKPVINKEEKITRPDGEEKWVSASKVPRYDKKGNVAGLLGISRDITERKQAEERQEFLHALLRHDLRNKITVIEGYLDLLEEAEIPQDQSKFLRKAMKVARDSSNLIEKVRTLRKVEDEKIEEIRIDPVLETVVSESEPTASDKGIEIGYEKCYCKVKAGPLLEELFSNLVENAIIHSNCGEIRIFGEKSDEECVVSIEDDGCGIPDDSKDKIFERGYKGGDSSGSGLGMYLVKRIAESYGGKVEVKDSELGGTKFDVHLKTA